MKKLSLIIFASVLCFVWTYAQSDYVVKQEFQEKTQSLGAQVSSVKKLSKDINQNLSNVKGSVEALQTQVTAVEQSIAENNEAIKAENTALKASLAKYKQKNKMALVVLLVIAFAALAIVIASRKNIIKKVVLAQKQLDETNNMLIEQGKSLDRKIAVLSDSIASLKEEKPKKAKKE